VAALVAARGASAPPSPYIQQDNSLQAWSWIDGTFSWVEPTSWAMLALKKSMRGGEAVAGAAGRIAEAERLMTDRACRGGGWNFGNAMVMDQALPAHVPTSAIGLLALQDRPDDPVVRAAIGYLDRQWAHEASTVGLALAMMALAVYGRETRAVETRLRAWLSSAAGRAPGNLHAQAVALCALTRSNALKL
jgi:hypothetical protein